MPQHLLAALWSRLDRFRSAPRNPYRDLDRFRPRLEILESRLVPTINFVFDFSHDSSGFFTSNPQAVATLQLAGQILGSQLNDSLRAITPSGSNSWSAIFLDPTTRVNDTITNLNVPANTIIVYAGGHNYGGSTVGEGGYGGWNDLGDTSWTYTVATRGQAGAAGSPATDVGPWGGSVSFDTLTNWNFGGLNSPPAPGQTDFLSVAMHELGHVLGFGTAPSWFNQVSNGVFTGATATAVNNGVHPAVSSTNDHWAQTDMDPTQGQPDMTPIIQIGTRKLFTNLDYAALEDIGWQVTGFTPGSAVVSPSSVTATSAVSTWAPNDINGEPLGSFDPTTATWYLRSSPTPGNPNVGVFQFGASGWTPLTGDWNGDGTAGIGVYDPSTATWYLRNEASAGSADAGVFQFGLPGWIPVVGHWTGTGQIGIGVIDPATGTWYLRSTASAGPADVGVFQFGTAGWIPVVGSWTGSSATGIGMYDPSTATWYLRNEATAGPADAGVFQYGAPGWKPIVGDWDSNGTTTVGLYNPTTATFYIRNENSGGSPDGGTFAYGGAGWTPVVGYWNGQQKNNQAAQAPDHAMAALVNTALSLFSGHSAGGYCHCAMCQAAAAAANAMI
jgi:hypothetical protein